jgi:hypothetical protein
MRKFGGFAFLALAFAVRGQLQNWAVALLNLAVGFAVGALAGWFVAIPTPWRYLLATAAGLVALAVALTGTGWALKHFASAPQPAKEAPAAVAEPAGFVSSLPIQTIEEAAELAEQCTATSKAIYAFLTKAATRTDEANVLAEYRQKFDARVSGLYIDLLSGGFSPPDQLATIVTSLTDIQWIARILTDRGEGYRAERLEKLSARALKELQAQEPNSAALDEAVAESATPEMTLADGRVIIDATPAYLVGFFKGHTHIQAEKLTEAYRGKWLKVSGPLGDVMGNTSERAQVTFARNAPIFVGRYFQVFMYFDRSQWDDRLSVLRPGTKITVIGRIREINRIEVHLENCELVDA